MVRPTRSTVEEILDAHIWREQALEVDSRDGRGEWHLAEITAQLGRGQRGVVRQACEDGPPVRLWQQGESRRWSVGSSQTSSVPADYYTGLPWAFRWAEHQCTAYSAESAEATPATPHAFLARTSVHQTGERFLRGAWASDGLHPISSSDCKRGLSKYPFLVALDIALDKG